MKIIFNAGSPGCHHIISGRITSKNNTMKFKPGHNGLPNYAIHQSMKLQV